MNLSIQWMLSVKLLCQCFVPDYYSAFGEDFFRRIRLIHRIERKIPFLILNRKGIITRLLPYVEGNWTRSQENTFSVKWHKSFLPVAQKFLAYETNVSYL